MRMILSLIPGMCLLTVLTGCGSERAESRDALSALPAPAEAGERCPHGAAIGACFLCDASLREPGRLWCGEHARYEDRCWICHPELRDAARPYCDAHGLYEDECTFCGGSAADHAQAADGHGHGGASSDRSGDIYCSEHRVYERECGICQPALADALRPGEGLKIRLASAEAADKAGIAAGPITRAAGAEAVIALGELAFHGDRLVHLTPLVEGVVREVRADLGAEVKRGDRLVGILSSAGAEAQAAYRRAVAEAVEAERKYEREVTLHAQGVCSAQEVEEARARREG